MSENKKDKKARNKSIIKPDKKGRCPEGTKPVEYIDGKTGKTKIKCE